MEPSLRHTVEHVSAGGGGEPGWDTAVLRAARIIAPRWPTREWSASLPWALQTLALLLYVLDRDERLDDPALRTAIAPYVRTEGAESLHTGDGTEVTRALLSEHLPEGGPLSLLFTLLTTRPEPFVVMDLPSMETHMPLAPALEWLAYFLRKSAPSS